MQPDEICDRCTADRDRLRDAVDAPAVVLDRQRDVIRPRRGVNIKGVGLRRGRAITESPAIADRVGTGVGELNPTGICRVLCPRKSRDRRRGDINNLKMSVSPAGAKHFEKHGIRPRRTEGIRRVLRVRGAATVAKIPIIGVDRPGRGIGEVHGQRLRRVNRVGEKCDRFRQYTDGGAGGITTTGAVDVQRDGKSPGGGVGVLWVDVGAGGSVAKIPVTSADVTAR